VIKYLTVLEERPLFIKPVEQSDIDKIYLVPYVDEPKSGFEILLSSLVQPDNKPLKIDDLLFDVTLDSQRTKTIFEILKLINSEECGLQFYKEDDGLWKVMFKVGSKYEDKGEVYITKITDAEFSELNKQFLIELSESEYMIKYHQKDIANCFSVLDKSSDSNVSIKLKKNTGLIIQESCENYDVNFGFVPFH